MGFKWIVAPTDVFPQMASKYTQAVIHGTQRVLQEQAAEAEAWMKANAPWQDRTGAARAGLTATVEGNAITLAHGVDYGLWLEIANQGKYAIIAPAIDYWGPRIMGELQHMLATGHLPGFTFSSSASRFRNVSTGRFVSRRQITGLLGQ